MQELPKHISEEQLAKYFANELSVQEKNQIETWRDQSIDNQITLDQYQMLWEDLGTLKGAQTTEMPLTLNVDAAWNLHTTMRNKPVTRTSDNSRFLLVGIAAMLIVSFGLGWMIFSWQQSTEVIIASGVGATETVQLPDGSSVTLNEKSTLSYPEKFVGNSRYVKMTGEVFFDVQPDASKPFTIEVGQARVTVLGTSFNVHSSQTMDTVSVFVQTGKVKLKFAEQELVLTKGQKGVLYKNRRALELYESQTTGIDQFWRTRVLTFSGEKLQEVIQRINTAYDEHIELASTELATCSLDVTFENDSFENIVEVIAMTLNLQVEQKGEITILKGSGCAR